jgi:hypothetical protein
VTTVDIIHCPVFYLKQDVSEAGFCVHLQVKPIRLGPLDRAILWSGESPEHHALNKRLDDNVQDCVIKKKVPSPLLV